MGFDFEGPINQESSAHYDDFLKSLIPAFGGLAGGTGGLAGVAITGFATAGMEFAAGDPVGGTLQALQTALSMIGRGRKEADEITAVQTPVGQLLEQVNQEMGVPSITLARLQSLRQYVTAGGAQLQQVLARPWKDGRAAEQCKATMFTTPGYLRVTLENIDKMIAERQNLSSVPTIEGAAGALGTTPAVLIAGVAAWLLFK